MKCRTWMACWPGLAGLWLRGRLRSVAVAAAFALVLNCALVTTFLWPRLLAAELPAWAAPTAAWVLVLWFWVMGRRASMVLLGQEAAKSLQPDEASDELLAEAQVEYLKGHWPEAEARLLKVLARRPGDAESRLLLATVYRRSGQADKARREIEALSQLPSAADWREELREEARLLSSGEKSAGRAFGGSLGDQRRSA